MKRIKDAGMGILMLVKEVCSRNFCAKCAVNRSPVFEVNGLDKTAEDAVALRVWSASWQVGGALAKNKTFDEMVAFCYLGGMSQPVKVSDGLVLDARLMGAAAQRSIAGQIEFWAGLGRALEMLLRGDQVLALCRAGQAKPLSTCVKSVDSAAGRRRLKEYLHSQPYPHYEPAPGSAGLLVRIEANGKRTTGRFINRNFEPVKAAKP